MLEKIFSGIFSQPGEAVISVGDFLLCILASLIAGVAIAAAYTYKSRYTKSFLMTICILPAVVCAVIMMVNGNIGTGVAVAGAFSLVRFRSAPGSAKEICTIFIAMGAGLISGMGYLAYSILFAILLALITVAFKAIKIGSVKENTKALLITIPEDLSYDEVFDEILNKYTKRHELVSVKTSNLGSLFKLKYLVDFKSGVSEKSMIDELRCRNGNLEIRLSTEEMLEEL
ncbi:MAG: DUF4956 domain-containing protein [Clostridia bacterium]|nr:DUF4956 domain-containing protein [Clostridia bacterium]MBQ9704546.1 DUF4956 domain-containing protein [Clostridia bacterium]